MPVSPDKRPIDLALDLLLYVPVGLAVTAQEALPRLATRGRERITGRIDTARIVGQFTVQQGQARAGKLLTRPAAGPEPVRNDGPASEPAAAPAGAAPQKAPRLEARPPVASAAAAVSAPGDHLAIPGYDSLSASQVLPRLEGLAIAELEAVRAYETAHRARRTILGRVAQLQSAS